ncbi:2OG-Fe(II) oxygenase [Kaarinaea lacus]
MVVKNHFTICDDGVGGVGDIYRQIAVCIGERGWCVTPEFLSPLLVAQLQQETNQLWSKGKFRHAGVGRGDDFEINPKIRTDHVLWLDQQNVSGAQKLYFDALEKLRLAINQHLYLGLMEFEAHFAVYPKNSYYKKHLDQFRGIGTRTVSAILYINNNWSQKHGGQLRLYTDQNSMDGYIDIIPKGGTLVTFLSARFLHEVLPASRSRKSITGWFKRRE